MTAAAPGRSQDVIRLIAVVLSVASIAAVSIWIMAPFLPAIAWAATIALATWPLLLRLQGWLGGKRWAASAVLTTLLVVCFFGPLLLVFEGLFDYADDAAVLAKDLAANGLPAAPAWLARIPVAGSRLADYWNGLAQLDPAGLRDRLEPALKAVSTWLLGSAGSLLRLVLQVILTIVVTSLLYASGEKAAAGVRAFAHRIGGDAGESLAVLAGGSARAVALGVVVTAVLQALLTGIALALAGVPGAGLLGGAALVLCLAQVGPLIILAAAVGWLYWQGHTTAATALLVASVGLVSMDNILKPILITRGANLPLLLVFVGVVGGMFAFGLIGIFIGPVVLAAGWTLVSNWVAGVPAAGGTASS